MHQPYVTRRTLLRATSASVAAAATASALGSPALAASSQSAAPPAFAPGRSERLFRELDERIRTGMVKYGIPGVAVAVLYRGAEYVRGYGVTNVDYPVPVDGDTVFRIGSTTKTFTGTTVMRLVEQGRLALDAPVRSYLPDFHTSDPSVAARVTVRQLLNHTAGWLGDYLEDTGEGDDATARYAAVALAGRVIEVVTGMTYETAVRELLVDPMGLAHSRFFVDEIIGFNVAASHNLVGGKPVVEPAFFRVWRSLHAAGGLISSVRDQLRYARFHLGDGTVPGSDTRLLTRQSLLAMRTRPGPGGTLFVELDGMGVTWMLRPSAEGVHIVQHGGDWPGQHSGFLMVPERGFAFTMLTNSEGGPGLVAELFADDWALRRFAGISNLPAVPRALTPQQLAPYEGRYIQQAVGPAGDLETLEFELAADNGQLVGKVGGVAGPRLAFYRPDYVLVLGPDGEATHIRANFLRGAGGHVDWHASAAGWHGTNHRPRPPRRPARRRSTSSGRGWSPQHSR